MLRTTLDSGITDPTASADRSTEPVVAVEPCKQSLSLFRVRVVEEFHEIDATRSDERRIESIDVIGRHEDDAFLGGRYTIESVEQSTKGD
jgi:hypothetical protein